MSLIYSLDPVFEKTFCARTVKDYELTLETLTTL